MSENILIISDPHFGALFDPKFGSPKTLCKQIVTSLQSDKRSPDLILCPGDLTSQGFSNEFKQAKNFLYDIAAAFDLDRSDVITLVGNHDVNREIFKSLDTCDRIKVCEHSQKRLATQVHSCHFWHEFDIVGPVYGCGIFKRGNYNLVIFNSSLNCVDKESKHGGLGTEQLIWFNGLKKDSVVENIPMIVVLHHHPEILPYPVEIKRLLPDYSQVVEGAELMRACEQFDVRLLIHGHRHHPVLTDIITKGTNPRKVPILCAGSVGVKAEKRINDIPNFFHFLEFNPDEESSDLVTYHSTARGVWVNTFNEEIHATISPFQSIPGYTDSQLSEKDRLKLIKGLDKSKKKITFHDLPAPLRCLQRKTLINLFETYAKSQNLDICGDYLTPKGMVFIQNQ